MGKKSTLRTVWQALLHADTEDPLVAHMICDLVRIANEINYPSCRTCKYQESYRCAPPLDGDGRCKMWEPKDLHVSGTDDYVELPPKCEKCEVQRHIGYMGVKNDLHWAQNNFCPECGHKIDRD